MTKFYILSEDYNEDKILFISNLTRNQLIVVLAQILCDIENGTGRTPAEVAADLFTDDDLFFKEIDIEEVQTELKELKTEVLYSLDGFTISEV